MNAKKAGAKRLLLAVLTVTVMLTIVVLPAVNASAAIRVSNPTEIDGIDPDPAVGVHNSYAWCGALFEQDDGDYLWVGTNRDLGAVFLGATGVADPAMFALLGAPGPDSDQSGKIYRCLADGSGEWELMWEDPAFSGYRKMLVFDGYLYVFAGMTNRIPTVDHPFGFQYSVIYRFAANFQAGDTPEVVLWSMMPPLVPPMPVMEFYRAGCVYDGMLYAGSFDLKVYRTDGTGLASLTPNNLGIGDKSTGWELVVDLKNDLSYDPGDSIWDIICFNDELYIFVTGSSYSGGTGDDAFKVYKVALDGSGTIEQIVGEDETTSQYPCGLGIKKHIMASPFLVTVDDVDYVYVTTFIRGPIFLSENTTGKGTHAFDYIFCPAAMYRFDSSGVWEVVVGDSTGYNVAVDRALDPVPFANGAYLRAGFSLNHEIHPNLNANQYIWWMTQDATGRIWASTWDVGVLRPMAPMMLVASFAQGYGSDAATVQSLILNTFIDLMAVVDSIGDGSGQAAAMDAIDELSAAVDKARAAVEDALIRGRLVFEAPLIVTTLNAEILAALNNAVDATNADLVVKFGLSMAALINATVIGHSAELMDGLSLAMETLWAASGFLVDMSNPAGFDLFYSDDGIEWTPYTVNGFNDPHNYGGRVLIPTENYGLFVLTANPFTGCQVWNVSGDEKVPLAADIPASVNLNATNEVSFLVKYIGPHACNASVVVGDGTFVDATIEVVENVSTMQEYWSTVYIVRGIVPGITKYVEIPDEVVIYKVTLKGVKNFAGEADVVIKIGCTEITETSTFNVAIQRPDPKIVGDSSTDVGWIIGGACLVVAIAVLLGLALARRP